MTTAPDTPAPSPRRRGRWLAGALAIAAVLAGGWWLTHPTRLHAVGSEVRTAGFLGQPTLVGLFAYPQEGVVRLRDAKARVVSNSADAAVRVLWCQHPVGGTPVGVLRARATAACRSTPALEGQRLASPTEESDFGHLVLEIVPLRAGEVTVRGADIAYTAGVQRGSQSSGVVVRVTARG